MVKYLGSLLSTYFSHIKRKNTLFIGLFTNLIKRLVKRERGRLVSFLGKWWFIFSSSEGIERGFFSVYIPPFDVLFCDVLTYLEP
jgi:hypothetical protein